MYFSNKGSSLRVGKVFANSISENIVQLGINANYKDL